VAVEVEVDVAVDVGVVVGVWVEVAVGVWVGVDVHEAAVLVFAVSVIKATSSTEGPQAANPTNKKTIPTIRK